LSPFALERDRVHPVRLGELAPALPELAAVDDHGGVALAQEVHEGGLHRAGPAGREHEDVLLRLEEPAQPLAHAAENGLELRRAVVDYGPRHPQGEPLRDGRRTRGEQADLLLGAPSQWRRMDRW